MKYIKIFESEFKKTFSDWLKNPKKTQFVFEFPVRKVFNADESNLDLLKMVDYLKYQNGINLYKDISNEIRSEEEDDEDITIKELSELDVKRNFDEYFDKWINQQYNGDLSKFFRMYDLDHIEDEINEEDFDSLKESFNSENLSQYYPYKEMNHNFKILKMEVTSLSNNNIVVGEIEVDRPLTEDEISSISDFIEGQCSDGWGEGFSQEQDVEVVNGFRFLTRIETWWGQGYPNWHLTIK